jgi:hypothetical protein
MVEHDPICSWWVLAGEVDKKAGLPGCGLPPVHGTEKQEVQLAKFIFGVVRTCAL